MRIITLMSLLLAITLACKSNRVQPVKRTETSKTVLSAMAANYEPLPAKDLDQHVKELRKRVPNDFSILIQPPFVVVGDEPEQVVRERSETTIKWAVDKLKQDFFSKDPEEIIDVWLFKDSDSYEKHAKLIFNDKPTTPYGYYSRQHRALIMNIATGSGTLVHEIVHPFVEANFPSCPPWLNEGLGSLYEQCGEHDGHIHGFVNWRLPGLQKAIKAGEVPSFKELTAMDTAAFYGHARGINYAQARYLCYYLQEKGLLVKFYKQFLQQHPSDPGGFKTLQNVLGEPDMNVFKKKWERYVLGLSQEFSLRLAN